MNVPDTIPYGKTVLFDRFLPVLTLLRDHLQIRTHW